jgi:hypothetical protein
MTATGIIFKIITISSSGTESDGATLPAIFSKDIAISTNAVKIAQPIPGRREYYFPKGDDAPKAKINCRLYGSGITGKTDNATAWMQNVYSGGAWTGVFANTLLKVVSSEYDEFKADSYWWVDNKTIKRSGGYYNIFEMEIAFIRSFYTIQDAIRST